MSSKYDFAVFIGRFQPFHAGHLRVIKEGLKIADNIIILVGSSNSARTTRNPFTYAERERMIRNEVVRGEYFGHIFIHPLTDHLYTEDTWKERVKTQVDVHSSEFVSPSICLIGNERDFTSYYLRSFPEWTFVPVFDDGLQATDVRKLYFQHRDQNYAQGLPSETWEFMQDFRQTQAFSELVQEKIYYEEYQSHWGPGPHYASDAMVVQKDDILLVERGHIPGRGLFAIPGGFRNPGEKALDASIRELSEETGLLVNKHNLIGSQEFGDPHRSQRGHVVTEVFLFRIPSNHRINVRGSDDARWAGMKPLSDIRVNEMFEDHGHIIPKMLTLL